MSIYKAPPNSADLQKKFKDLMLSLSEEQVYQLANSGITKDTMFSISSNRAVYHAVVGYGCYNTFKVLDLEKMELQQPIQLKSKYENADPKLSQIGEFKLKASAETIKAFLAFSDVSGQLFVCPLNESDSNIREPFEILHDNPDKAQILGLVKITDTLKSI